MSTVNKLYKTIRFRSNTFKEDGSDWQKRISSAKNYIATSDLKHWTFGKSAGIDNVYLPHGGMAKKWQYSIGFIDVLKLPKSKFKSDVIKAFFNWAEKINCFDIVQKFEKDKLKSKRFELLVHSDVVPVSLHRYVDSKELNQELFDEGFRREVIIEVAKRDRRIIAHAKKKYGFKCEVCEFDFGKTYGLHGKGFIEIHHLVPIAQGERKTKVEDLRPVCANCHRMLHKGTTLLSVKELKEIIAKSKRT